MVIDRRIFLIAITLLVLSGVGLLTLSGILNTIITPQTSYKTSIGIITIRVSLPETPQNFSRYHVVSRENDIAYYSVTNLEQVRLNVTSESDAPSVASKSLEKYGGLPEGAILVYNKTGYLEEKSGTTYQVIAKYPISTDVQYGRKLNGIKVTGDGGFIKIVLGNDGELLYLNKVWRTVEPAGTEMVIPVSKAIEKLGRGDVLDPLKCICDLNVDRIYLAYWEKGAGVPQEYLDPVWVFSGTTSSGEVINYKVYARESDDFPVTPVSGFASVQANVTSESHPPSLRLEDNESANTTVKYGNIS
ncbi:MAG: hypothetical protein Q7T80_12885 [Methanoregula sp.]|nr:hypothetical protein [Methanoregula sp.]